MANKTGNHAASGGLLGKHPPDDGTNKQSLCFYIPRYDYIRSIERSHPPAHPMRACIRLHKNRNTMQLPDPRATPCRGGIVGRRSVAVDGAGGDSPSPQGVAVLAPYLECPLLVRKLHSSVRDRRVLAVARGGSG